MKTSQDKVIFDINGLNIHVEDSWLVDSKTGIADAVDEIMIRPEFILLCHSGFTRTRGSMINEWCAHNFLYEHNYKPESTKDVDINQGESWFRRFCYTILSALYKGTSVKKRPTDSTEV